MSFLKTSILSALSTVIKLASGLVVNKIIAIYIGPAGIALIGQFQNFVGIITTIGNGAINSGVTKYVAEYNEENPEKRNNVIVAAYMITIIFSVVIGAIVFLGSSFISSWIMKSEEYSAVFKLLGILLVFISFNTVLLSIINGLKRIKLFIAINISSSLLSLVITSILAIKYQLIGALYAYIIVQTIVLIVTLALMKKRIDLNIKIKKIEKGYFMRLFQFSVMAITSVLAVTVMQMVIRNYLIDEFSIQQAGYWQSMWMISSMYLMILTTALSTYYLPKLSELQELSKIRKEIISGYKIILPFVLVTATSIYFLRDFIICLLFTPDFIEMRNLFFYQLVGDFFKMASWTLAYLMIAKAMTKTFIVTEIIFSVSFFVFTVVFTQMNGLIGVTQAYALNYLLYLLLMIILFSRILFIKTKINEIIDK